MSKDTYKGTPTDSSTEVTEGLPMSDCRDGDEGASEDASAPLVADPAGKLVKRSAFAVKIMERRREALKLRLSGASYDQIQQRMPKDYKDKSHARKDVQEAILAIIKEPAEEVRKLELARLDAMLEALWEKALQADTAAIDRVVKIMERRARYEGIDSPIEQVVVGGTLGDDAREQLLARINRIAAARAAGTHVEGHQSGGVEVSAPQLEDLGETEPDSA